MCPDFHWDNGGRNHPHIRPKAQQCPLQQFDGIYRKPKVIYMRSFADEGTDAKKRHKPPFPGPGDTVSPL